jgi:pimeloyl-ACP methyl ester carboxylesterase
LEDSPDRDRYTALMNEQMRYRGFRASTLSQLRNDALGDYMIGYRAVGRQARAVLLLWGTADLEITRAKMDTARAEIPNAVFRSFDGFGHGMLFQHPDLINHHLLGFLNGHTPASR